MSKLRVSDAEPKLKAACAQPVDESIITKNEKITNCLKVSIKKNCYLSLYC